VGSGKFWSVLVGLVGSAGFWLRLSFKLSSCTLEGKHLFWIVFCVVSCVFPSVRAGFNTTWRFLVGSSQFWCVLVVLVGVTILYAFEDTNLF
jgi:hypothetical protein